MSPEADGDAPFLHGAAYLEDFSFSAQEHDVDGEFHPDGVNAFAGDDPEALPIRQTGSAE